MLYLCASALCSQESIQNWNCSSCKPELDVRSLKLIYDDPTNTLAYVAKNEQKNYIVATFRGTVGTSITNWVTDLEFAQTTPYPNVPGAGVHDGFFYAYTQISNEINEALIQLVKQNPSSPIYLTGHSMGAALAVIAAVNLSSTFNLNLTMYNYGEPRTGNDVFADYYHSQVPSTFRVVNYRDLVPHYPPELIGFHHVATEVWYDGSGNYNICDESGEDPNCSDSIWVYSIGDHVDYMGVEMSCND